jgi:alanine racemase
LGNGCDSTHIHSKELKFFCVKINCAVGVGCTPQAKVVTMVKANAYGHHLNLVTPLLENADILAVSEIQEAQALRQTKSVHTGINLQPNV